MGLKEKALKRLKREIHLKIIWGIYFLISTEYFVTEIS